MPGESVLNRFRNTAKLISHSQDNWLTAASHDLIDLYVSTSDIGHKVNSSGVEKDFINMSSYSYLGLNRNLDIIDSAIEALKREKITSLGIAPTRIRSRLVADAQSGLSDLFGSKCLISLSCSVATSALLPLVSSGHLGAGKPYVTVFDKQAHFCMDWIKPICADEAQVISAPHNDINFLEDICKKNSRVAYVADGAYSLGGTARLDDLLSLQERYGLFLWFDDSHSLSVIGSKGEGYVKSRMGELNPLTIIVASLDKGFGCSGGVVMLDKKLDTSLINTFAGPMCWSQNLNTANLGSILASIKIHNSRQLGQLQERLQRNITYFDEAIPTKLKGSSLPIRGLPLGDAQLAIKLSKSLFDQGFYCAPSYFPITPRGKEGLRVMLRADHREQDLDAFCTILKREVVPHLSSVAS